MYIMSMIRLVNMTKRFGKTVAVKNADLEIEIRRHKGGIWKVFLRFFNFNS